MIRKVVVGISGGVDSAVAALLLKNKGYNVQGVFMKNWDLIDETGVCTSQKDWTDAQWICDRLKIPLVQVNFVKEYWNEVFGSFLKDYQLGRTPNPDIQCNAFIKFSSFYTYAREHLSADAISTGHYARTSFGNYLEDFQEGKNVKLLCPADKFKDQTFFLSQVPQHGLRRSMFPLGNILKCDVKMLASDAGLTQIAKKRESVGICFVGKRNLYEFISEYVESNPGEFVDFDTGEIMGSHDGIHYWTVGQRARLISKKSRMYILRKHSDQRTILLAAGGTHPALYTNILYTDVPHWIDENPLEASANVFQCKFRFQHMDELMDCMVFPSKRGLFIKLKEPLRALTPGQYAVFYRDEECLGSARITSPGPSMLYVAEEEQLFDYKKRKLVKKETEGVLFKDRLSGNLLNQSGS